MNFDASSEYGWKCILEAGLLGKTATQAPPKGPQNAPTKPSSTTGIGAAPKAVRRRLEARTTRKGERHERGFAVSVSFREFRVSDRRGRLRGGDCGI